VLLIAFVGLVASVALAVVYRGKISDSLHDALEEGLDKYDNDTGCQEAVDLMQSQVGRHCCTLISLSAFKKQEITSLEFDIIGSMFISSFESRIILQVSLTKSH